MLSPFGIEILIQTKINVTCNSGKPVHNRVMKQRFIEWFKRVTNKKWIMWFLGVNAFFESIIFPIPIDIFTFTLASAHPQKWKRYGTVATFWSVTGAIGGYFLGMYLFDTFGQQLIDFYGYQEQFDKVFALFDNNTFLVMFTSAFTPIPYKVFTIAGGALQVSLFDFILASILGRGLRFFAETYIPYKFGEKVGGHILKNFNRYTLLVAVLVVGFILIKNLW